MEMTEKKKKRGCLATFLVILAFFAVALLVIWFLFLAKYQSNSSKEIFNTPVDDKASVIVENELSKDISGLKAVVVALPSKKGNAVIISIDPSTGFVPASGKDGKTKQALDIMKKIVVLNDKNKLELSRVGLEYNENGTSFMALTAPLSALKDVTEGKINSQAFLAQVNVRLYDLQFIVDTMVKRKIESIFGL